jgi:hypothetical protein
LEPTTDGTAANPDSRLLLQLLTQFVKGGIRHSRDQLGQLLQLVFGEFRVGSPAMRQRGDIAAVPLLAQQLVNEGFVHAEQLGDLPFASELTLYGIDYALSEV